MDDAQLNKLNIYYKNYYPFKKVFSAIPINENREISFSFQNSIYTRYNTFCGHEELASWIEKTCPVRVDIGAVYREAPAKGKANIPVCKELVFDIDLTDYKRDCCTGKAICEKCFAIIKSSVKLLSFSLREEFGFRKINFFFSGGRGLHCWVSDEEALSLNDYARRSICSYFDTVISKKQYPEEYKNILLEYSSDGDEDFLFQNFFPRLDRNVTSDIRHLLKAPFCIHMQTEKVCVCLAEENIDRISLRDIPSLDDVLNNPAILDHFISNINSWN